MLLGIVVFGDKLRSGAVASTARSLALIAVRVATGWLSRAHRLERERPAPVGTGV